MKKYIHVPQLILAGLIITLFTPVPNYSVVISMYMKLADKRNKAKKKQRSHKIDGNCFTKKIEVIMTMKRKV